jgi:restriction endonuclease S subunit
MRLADCLDEVKGGINADWRQLPVLGATRDGLAPANDSVGKYPEKYKQVTPGTVFYNPMRIMIGSIPMLDEGQAAGITSPDYVVIRPRPGVVHFKWFYYWMRSPYGEAFIKRVSRGAVRERILFRRLAPEEIEIPAWDQQEKFAARMGAVERARAAAEAQLEAAKALPAAYLRDVFDGADSEHWPRKRIREYAKVQSGYAFKSDWFVAEGIRLLRNANIFQNRIEWDDVVCLPETQRMDFAAFELSIGDIVLTLDRPIVSNGLKVARITKQDVPSLLLQRVGRFQLRNAIDASYLFGFLNSPNFIKQITGHDHSLGVPHISPK